MNGKWILSSCALLLTLNIAAQEVYFFSEATDANFYDQGIVDVTNLGESVFEYTHPPGGPQYNDKVPASDHAYRGSTSLKFNYTSSANGNWRATIYRNDWSAVNIADMDSLSFYIFSENDIPSDALPLIGIRARNVAGTGDVNTNLYPLSEYNDDLPAGQWVRITFPLGVIMEDEENSSLDFENAMAVIYNQSENDGSSRLFFLDQITAFKYMEELLAVEDFTATGYDSHAELTWNHGSENISFRIYASFDDSQTFEVRGETAELYYLDFIPAEHQNQTVIYRLVAVLQETESEPAEASAEIRDFTDEELLDMVQQYTFRYFWEGAHQPTGMALERSNGNNSTAASGATGMGLMAMIIAHEREYHPREEVKDRILSILEFLENSERHHGAWSHWYNADTYETQPFSADDDGGDIVETSYVAAGLIAMKNYFTGADEKSVIIRETADKLWKEIDWDWYRNGGQNALYWHWSPNVGFKMNMRVTGWNESLVTYVMAASSPTHGIPAEVYDIGWARNGNMVRPRSFYGRTISLAPDWGGPLFWMHYSHLGINPQGLRDKYADYWQEHVNTALIHHAYAVDNPQNHEGYSEENWGLTASDSPGGYTAHHPVYNDNGTISPTAALASMPYTPEESMKALKYFYRERGQDLFGIYGPYDAFNDNLGWVQRAYIGIDQGPIVVMLENHRTGLLWNVVMQDEDVQAGLDKLGFEYQVVTSATPPPAAGELSVYPNPASDVVRINMPENFQHTSSDFRLFGLDGRLIMSIKIPSGTAVASFNSGGLKDGIYIIHVTNEGQSLKTRLIIQH
jgi:hypothetical protein